jgi:hypothetical protein
MKNIRLRFSAIGAGFTAVKVEKNNSMVNLEELPEKCQKCAKTGKPAIHRKCDFGRDLEFSAAAKWSGDLRG